jgi:hypothetical protein
MNRKKRKRRRLKTLRAVAPRTGITWKQTVIKTDDGSRYERDTIVMMPVNRDTSFVFWELSGRSLNGSMDILLKGEAKLVVKVYDQGRGRQVCSFDAPGKFGSHYVVIRNLHGPLIAEIGLQDRGSFRRLLGSGPCSLPAVADSKKDAAPCKWMKQEGDTCRVTTDKGAGHSIADDKEFLRYLMRNHFSGSSIPK